MAFEKTIPQWNAQGSEPPSSLKESGFTAGYKPPADYFNWFWYNVAACLAELQENLSNVDNTADADKSVKSATSATTANKVGNAIVIKLNNGTTEGTDMFTFNGSAAKTLNITPALIGAATTTAASSTTAGLMSAADKAKLDTITENADAVSFTRALTSGTKIGSLTINGTTVDLYCQSSTEYVAATTSAAGLMSAADKTKLDGISTGATAITVDSALSSTSTNPVQNKVINTALSNKAALSHDHSASNITSGTLVVERGGTGVATATKNYVFAAPNGSTGAPAFRALVSDDIPSLYPTKIKPGAFSGSMTTDSTGTADVTASQIRDIYAGTADMTAGYTTLLSGRIYLVYE